MPSGREVVHTGCKDQKRRRLGGKSDLFSANIRSVPSRLPVNAPTRAPPLSRLHGRALFVPGRVGSPGLPVRCLQDFPAVLSKRTLPTLPRGLTTLPFGFCHYLASHCELPRPEGWGLPASSTCPKGLTRSPQALITLFGPFQPYSKFIIGWRGKKVLSRGLREGAPLSSPPFRAG